MSGAHGLSCIKRSSQSGFVHGLSPFAATQPLPAGANPLSHVLSPIQKAGPRYQVFLHVQTTQDFLPPLTSTPSRLSENRKESQQVRLSVQYPSKNLNKTLHGTYQNVGKALAHGVPSRIATAVMDCPPVRNHIVEKVMKVVSKEVTGLCSKTDPSLLRKTEKEDLEKYDMEHVCKEWRERAPVFYSFLLSTSAANKSTKSSTWFGNLALAGSVLLKQRNREMSATAAVMGVLLKSKAVEV